MALQLLKQKACDFKTIFFLSLLFFVLGYVVRFSGGWNTYENDKLNYLKSIKHNVSNEIEFCKKEQLLYKKTLENKRLLFSNLMQDSRYPYFLFRNKKLVFWSDNEDVPSYNDVLAIKHNVGLLTIKHNIFVCVKDTVCFSNLDFEMVSTIPLKKANPLSSYHSNFEYNKMIFGDAKPDLFKSISKNENENISTPDGHFLFSLIVNEVVPYVSNLSLKLSLFLNVLGLVLVIWGLYLAIFIHGFFEIQAYKKMILWIISLFALRIFVFWADFPNVITNLELFNPRYYAYSQLIPSLGDFFLYLVVWTLIIWPLRGMILDQHKSNVNSPPRQISNISLFVNFLFVLSFGILCFTVQELGNNTYWNLDINSGLQYNLLRLFAYLSVILATFSFLLLYQLLITVSSELSWKKLLFQLSLNLCLNILTAIVFSIDMHVVAIHQLILVSTLTLATLINSSTLSLSKFVSFIYLVIVCAVINTFLIYQNSIDKNIAERKKYVNDVLSENDLYAEFLIHEASEKIKNDGLVKSRFLNPMSSVELIENKIRKMYFPRYFDKYEIQIDIFDVAGEPKFKNNSPSYHDLKRKYAKTPNKTEYRNLFLAKDRIGEASSKKYVNFIEIEKDEVIYGYIMLTFNRKRVVPHSVFPSLLVDKKFDKSRRKESYSYALFINDTLSFSYGSYYYPAFLSNVFKTKETEMEVEYNGYNHFVNNSSEGKTVIVSSPQYSFYSIISNFSFWFLIFILSLAIHYTWQLYTKRQQISLVSKIQVYVSLGFFFPMILVGLSSFGVFSNIYQDELKKDFTSIAERTSNLVADKEEIFEGKLNKESLHSIISEISRNIEVDVTVFDSKGQLIHSSEPLVFEKGLLAPLIHPKAYLSILESKKKSSIQSENIGSLNYFSAYSPVLSPKNGKLMGVVGIPFFESESELFAKITPVFLSIINVFTVAFLVLMAIFFFVSKRLVYPIKLLKNRMAEVSLENTSKPIDWDSDDEIGTLVKSYNRMLVKLEESKKLLTMREKESAWREMAKQVAHEIKNPLTPMKLMVQHNLLRSRSEPDKSLQIFESTSEIVLKQIDNLSDIATSFSNFANMPVPIMENYDFVQVANEVYDLHKTNEKVVDLTFKAPTLPIYTLGDKKLMFRIINNLLLNAIQSVDIGKTPKVEMTLTEEEDFLMFSVKDNGVGIPEDIQQKVFLPNFSTKYNGSGIGLAIAKNGVEFCGGKIWFETKINEGTIFYISLPKN